MICEYYIANIPEIVCHGHAGYEEKGRDIVCAMASVLMQTLDASIAEEHKETVIDENAGYMMVSWRGEGRVAKSERDAFAFAALGLSILAENYLENVRMEAGGGL